MKTVIEMAREAGLPLGERGAVPLWDKELKRFAELVASLVRADAIAKEREAMMQLFTDPENQPTQHGTVTVQYMQREIEAEREACAKVAEDMNAAVLAMLNVTRQPVAIAASIRARGNT